MSPDTEVVMGNGRAVLRFADAMGLADLVDRILSQSTTRSPDKA
jgi:hypothetical protein